MGKAIAGSTFAMSFYLRKKRSVADSFVLLHTGMQKRFDIVSTGITLLILVWFSLSSVPTYGADAADSLLQSQDTVTHIKYLNQLSEENLKNKDYEQALTYAREALQLAEATGDEEGITIALINEGKAYTSKGKPKKALANFVRSLKTKNTIRNKKIAGKLYYNMAVSLARLRRYPLALKYFHKAEQQQEKVDLARRDGKSESYGNFATADPAYPDRDTNTALVFYDDVLDITGNEDIVIDNDTILVEQHKDGPSKAINSAALTTAFDDGKNAIAYGLILHIKQPVAGKRQAFTGLNTVGHTFVTLTKFNTDSSCVSRTFGFYPDKDYLLSATPLLPVSSSVFKDDQEHDWDEIVAKFISRKQFNRILKTVKQYSKVKYNLNKNNCTDFGLVIAGIAGITIKETRGSWPLGSGNNPANAGQSVREGKLEQEEPELLFIYPNAGDGEL